MVTNDKLTVKFFPHIDKIARFCRDTYDSNNLHNQGYMAELGKYPFVPGMLTLFATVGSIEGSTLEKTRRIDAFFGEQLSPIDDVEISTITHHDLTCAPLEILLLANNQGRNVLELEGKKSSLSFESKHSIQKKASGMELGYGLNQEYLNSFSRITGFSSQSISNTFYAVAFGSYAMIEAIKAEDTSGLGEDAKELKQKLTNPDKKYLPAYSSFSINFPNGVEDIVDPKVRIRYILNLKKNGKRNYQINMWCYQRTHRIFNAEYQITPFPEKVIIEKRGTAL